MSRSLQHRLLWQWGVVRVPAAGGEGGVAQPVFRRQENQVISQLYKHACDLVLVSCSRLGPGNGPCC